MVSNPHLVANPGVIGAKVSVASAVVSFTAQGLPVAQFVAAVLGGMAALISMTWVAIQIYDRLTRK